MVKGVGKFPVGRDLKSSINRLQGPHTEPLCAAMVVKLQGPPEPLIIRGMYYIEWGRTSKEGEQRTTKLQK